MVHVIMRERAQYVPSQQYGAQAISLGMFPAQGKKWGS